MTRSIGEAVTETGIDFDNSCQTSHAEYKSLALGLLALLVRPVSNANFDPAIPPQLDPNVISRNRDGCSRLGIVSKERIEAIRVDIFEEDEVRSLEAFPSTLLDGIDDCIS